MIDRANPARMNHDMDDDFTGTLYDIGTQDLLDVWDAIDVENGEIGNVFSQNNNCWNGMFRTMPTPVLKDKLLTDSLISGTGDFPSCTVSNEHSYSAGKANSNGGAASDGDSIPESPLSLQDDMETECYPCIPMQSASNQKRSDCVGLISDNVSIKHEPLSPGDINVVDDEDNAGNKRSLLYRNITLSKHSNDLAKSKSQPKVIRKSSLLGGSSIPTRAPICNANFKLSQQRSHTMRITRPKHPQSLLKQQPVILMTASHSSSLPTVITTSSSQEVILHSTGDWSPAGSPASSSSGCSSSTSKSIIQRLPIQTSLISSQPKDGCGELELTEEEKKTLISEGYPIPTKLPLTKAEERSLKKIRRKIKNKISAQESRRKKKEFVDTLERKVEETSLQLNEYKKKCNHLQKENANLQQQVKRLHELLEQKVKGSASPCPDVHIKVELPDDSMTSNEFDLD